MFLAIRRLGPGGKRRARMISEKGRSKIAARVYDLA
jgi:hypothetical protein